MTCYGLAALCACSGAVLAARHYPGGFDWAYTVMSDLESPKHNPHGAWWFAVGLALCAAFLWPVVTYIRASLLPFDRLERIAMAALRIGLACMLLSALERVGFMQLSARVHKFHEMLALLGFVGLYVGTMALCAHRIRARHDAVWVPVGILLPLIAIGLSQFVLYVQHRDLGWVDPGWRALGVPVYLSFAFWEWLAAVALLAGLGYLLWSSRAALRRAASTA